MRVVCVVVTVLREAVYVSSLTCLPNSCEGGPIGGKLAGTRLVAGTCPCVLLVTTSSKNLRGNEHGAMMLSKPWSGFGSLHIETCHVDKAVHANPIRSPRIPGRYTGPRLKKKLPGSQLFGFLWFNQVQNPINAPQEPLEQAVSPLVEPTLSGLWEWMAALIHLHLNTLLKGNSPRILVAIAIFLRFLKGPG